MRFEAITGSKCSNIFGENCLLTRHIYIYIYIVYIYCVLKFENSRNFYIKRVQLNYYTKESKWQLRNVISRSFSFA